MNNKGSCLKDFEIVQKLGKGSFSSVYKVIRINDQTLYAMKKVKMSTLKTRQKQNAVNQVRILASINNPFIVQYKQAFFDQPSQTLCIVMEHAGNGDILKKVNEKIKAKTYFQQTQIWNALFQITKGLKHLHSMNIIHRDLKCANVFCSLQGTYKLGDLNVSKVVKRGMARTQTGTPYYASPQVWKDKPYDSKSDIWSLGCVIYEMTTLKPPFRAGNLKQLFNKIQKGAYEKIPSFYSEDLWNIIQSFLKVNPSLRPSAQEILQTNVIKKRFHNDKFINESLSSNKLLSTIKCPKDLRGLKQKLPGAKYNSKDKENSRCQSKNSNRNASHQKQNIRNQKIERAISAKPMPNNYNVVNKIPIYRPPPIPHKRLNIDFVEYDKKPNLKKYPISNRNVPNNIKNFLHPRVLTPNRLLQRNKRNISKQSIQRKVNDIRQKNRVISMELKISRQQYKRKRIY